MDVTDFRNLHDYVAESRHRFLAKFRDLGWEEVVRNRGATSESMHGIFIHMLEMEDSYVHYDIPGRPWPYGDRDPSAFKTFDDVEAYDRDLRTRTGRFLDRLTPAALVGEVVLEGERGKLKTTVEHVLLHTFIDEIAHIGELVCLMWQVDTEPPFAGWLRGHVTPA